jgi:hypothetical protein
VSSGRAIVADLLTTKVRCALEEQLRRRLGQSTINRLVRDGWLAKHSVLVRYPLAPMAEPLDIWRAGDPPAWQADPEQLAAKAKARWADRAARLMVVYVATERLAKSSGGAGDGTIKQPLQCTHDVHMLEVFDSLTRAAKARWQGEELLRSTGWEKRKKVPDAIIRWDSETFAVDLIGDYPATAVKDFQLFCLEEALSYLLY